MFDSTRKLINNAPCEMQNNEDPLKFLTKVDLNYKINYVIIECYVIFLQYFSSNAFSGYLLAL